MHRGEQKNRVVWKGSKILDQRTEQSDTDERKYAGQRAVAHRFLYGVVRRALQCSSEEAWIRRGRRHRKLVGRSFVRSFVPFSHWFFVGQNDRRRGGDGSVRGPKSKPATPRSAAGTPVAGRYQPAAVPAVACRLLPRRRWSFQLRDDGPWVTVCFQLQLPMLSVVFCQRWTVSCGLSMATEDSTLQNILWRGC